MAQLTGSELVTVVKKEIKEISVQQLKEQLNDLTVIDVRELDEWTQGKIDG